MTTKPAHFEIITIHPSAPLLYETFATYDEARTILISDPLLSDNSNHPFFWGNFFEIVLCGGDGCALTPNTN